MGSCIEIVGWTADADVYCTDCINVLYDAQCTVCGMPGKLFDPGWHDYRECREAWESLPEDMQPGPFNAHGYFTADDHEGNEIGAVFGDSEWDSPQHCGRCGALIDTCLTGDGVEYVRESLDYYALYPDRAGAKDVLEEWREAFGWDYDVISPEAAFLFEIYDSFRESVLTQVARAAVEFGRNNRTGWAGVYNYIAAEMAGLEDVLGLVKQYLEEKDPDEC